MYLVQNLFIKPGMIILHKERLNGRDVPSDLIKIIKPRMKIFIAFLVPVLVLTSCTRTYYIVRHAEKVVVNGNSSMMSNDPPLTEAGKERAEALKELLKTKKIGYIFSTNTIRTRSTA